MQRDCLQEAKASLQTAGLGIDKSSRQNEFWGPSLSPTYPYREQD